jgi:2-hydroxy-3-keto-5-methylthiopentenyl-1-phosphate phosphatase
MLCDSCGKNEAYIHYTRIINGKYKEEHLCEECALKNYDFDKTLSPDDMQAQGYIQSVGYNIADFWTESNQLAEENDMDQNLAYMYKMIQEAEGTLVFNKKTLNEYGSKVGLFPGVKEWFERIREYGKNKGVLIEHYIISSGLKEMIEGTIVAKEGVFEKIYASSFYFNDRGVAKWPAQVVNYTNKTQFLFRIEKGVLDINDQGVNDYFPPEEVRVPFRNMVYIGDSDTDIPCMKLVNSYGGHSIGVFNVETQDKTKVHKMMRDNRIRYYAPADYSEGTDLDILVKTIIDRTATNEALETIHYRNKKEYLEADKLNNEEEKKKTNLILALDNSTNFANTHTIIQDLNECDHWTKDESELLMDIAVRNSQVYCILGDIDVKLFYDKLLKKMSSLSENANIVKREIEKDK